MGFFSKLLGKKSAATSAGEQAVLVFLDGLTLPDEVYEQWDLATIQDRLVGVIESNSLGEFDGNEIGPEGATLFMYGPDADSLFAGIEATLRDCPLCQGARVVVRYGAPGSHEREIRL